MLVEMMALTTVELKVVKMAALMVLPKVVMTVDYLVEMLVAMMVAMKVEMKV